MTHQPQDPAYEQRVRDSFARQAFMSTLGAELQRVEPGFVEIAFGHRDDLTQQHGFVHAGVVASVADSACGYAAFSLMPADAGVLTVEFKVNLLAPARGSRFIARGRVLRAGRTLSTCLAEVVAAGADGETPIATLLGTIMTIHGRGDVRG